MANLATVLKEEIRRLARRELSSELQSLRKTSAQQRRDIAALKREVDAQQRELRFLQKQEKRRIEKAPPESVGRKARFSAAGVKSHREKLGLSAADYGKLVGVSALTIYNWESGKNRPRDAQLAKLVTVRGIGKREALKRLEMVEE